MSNKEFWDADWMAVQQKYWTEWLELSRKSGAAGVNLKSAWEQAQDHWWQAVSPAVPKDTRVFMEKMMDQGKQLFRLAGMFSGDASGPGPRDWQQTLRGLGEAFTTIGGGAGNGKAQHLLGFWKLPLESWWHLVSTLSLLPADTLGRLPSEGDQADLVRLLSVPGLGYSRERLAQQQKLARLLLKYQQAQDEYTKFFSVIGLRSVERMKRLLEQKQTTKETIDSAREFYDLWVATCEEVYTEEVMTPEYAKINGELVNALMAVRKQQGVMVDENLAALHMPTRIEIRTLQVRMQENRRENKRLKLEIRSLEAQLQGLREELQSVTGGDKRRCHART